MEQNDIKRFLVSIWPTIYRTINAVVYFIISVIREIVKIALQQLKGQ